MRNVYVTATREGWWVPGREETNLWVDDSFVVSLCHVYGQNPDSTGYFEADMLVRENDGKFKGGPAFDAVPWLVLTPQYEDVVDGVSMGQVYHATEVESGELLGVVVLCWEGLIEHFASVEPKELAVHPANFARVPSARFAIEEDYRER